MTRQTGSKYLNVQQVVMGQETEERLESIMTHYHHEYVSNEFIVKILEECDPVSFSCKSAYNLLLT